MTAPLTLLINGQSRGAQAASETPLLYVLRNDFGLNGPKFGCGLGQCGACTVLVDGDPVRSCITPAGSVAGRAITTLEGLGSRDSPHPVQTAFIDEQALQCGYCANGMMMASAALLARNPDPDDAAIRRALNDNLCRCGTHRRILCAVKRAARLMRTK